MNRGGLACGARLFTGKKSLLTMLVSLENKRRELWPLPCFMHIAISSHAMETNDEGP
jgi:hypothetical protein